MTCDGDRISWGDPDGGRLFGLVTRKRVGNGGTMSEGLDRLGSCRRLAVRDRHKTISVTATVTDEVNEDNIPLVGDEFTVPVNGRELAFRCQTADLDISVEDAATLTVTGRTLGEYPQPPSTNNFNSLD